VSNFTRGISRLARWLVAATALGAVAVMTTATPAAAHGLGGPQPTNYQTRVLGITPAVAGLRVTAVDLGGELQLTNSGPHEVTVLGYDGEPYLRVGPRGVYENTLSPAVFLNRTAKLPERVPASADPAAAPEWRRISSGQTVRWHDHRAHWMGPDDPPSVQRDPDTTHVVQRFRIEVRVGDQPVAVRGDVRWVPGPSPWPWVAAALVVAAVVALATRTRRWGLALGIALAIMIGAQLAHLAGSWDATTDSTWSQLGNSVYALVGLALAIAALTTLARRGRTAAVPLALLGGLFLALAGGLADITTLSRSQVPTTAALGLDRLTVALTLGLGVGVTVGATLRLRRPRPVAPTPAASPAAVPAGWQDRYPPTGDSGTGDPDTGS